MFSIDGVLYRGCTWLYNFALLNLLFLISCIPIITIFPASAALFGVTRQLVKKNDIPMFTKFRMYFVENFKQSFIIGILYTTVGVFLYIDYRMVGLLQSKIKLIVFACLVAMIFYYILSLLYIFPLMVTTYYTTTQLITNSFKFSLYKPHITFINLFACIATLFVSLRFPFLLVFFTSSVCAFVTYWFAERKLSTLVPSNSTETHIMGSESTNENRPIHI